MVDTVLPRDEPVLVPESQAGTQRAPAAYTVGEDKTTKHCDGGKDRDDH